MAKDREEDIISAQGQLDSAPAGGKSTYIKLPEKLPYNLKIRFFVPQKNVEYKRIFLPWRAGKFNPSAAQGKWATNRFIYVHKDIGPGTETYVCLQRTCGKPCPVCELFGVLRNKGADWEKVLKPLKFKDRELMLCFDPEQPKVIEIWDESTALFGTDFRMKVRRKTENLRYADLSKEHGKIVAFEAAEKKIGKGSCTEIPGASIEFEDRTEELPQAILDLIKGRKGKEGKPDWPGICVDDFVILPEYAKLAKLVKNTGGKKEEAVKDEDEDEDEKEEEEESEEEEEAETEEEESEEGEESEEENEESEEEESEEEEAEEEESEEAEEEEEEEEKPTPSKKPGKKPVGKKPTGKKPGKK